MPITKRTRFEVLRRDSHRCRYCGAGLDDGARLTVDHVTPVALGGTDTPDNLVAACIDCNAGKTSTSPDGPLVAQVAEDAVRWSRAMARAAQEAAADRQARDDILEAVDDAWREWKVGYKARVPYRPEDWQGSIERLIAAGLTAADLTELVDVAMRSKADDPWRPPELAPPAFAINHRHGQGVRMPKVA